MGLLLISLPTFTAGERADAAQPADLHIHLRAGSFDPLGETPLARQAAEDEQLPVPGDRLRLVQFPGSIRDAWYRALEDAGLEVVGYVPDFAYLVWGSEDATQRLQTTVPVRWTGVYRSDFALHPALLNTNAGQESVTVLVQLYAHTGAEKTIEAIIADAITVTRPPTLLRGFHTLGVRISADRLAWLAAQPGVVSVEPAPQYERLDEVQGQIVAGNVISDGSRPSGPGYLTWLTNGVGLPTDPTAYPIVDVTDDGIDDGTDTPQHPDFYEFGDTALSDRLVYNYNWTSDPEADGQDGHGTLNASIVAGYNNGTGVPYEDDADYNYGLGINPFGRVAGSKVFRNDLGPFDLGGHTYTDLISNTYALGARISSNSWGCSNCGGDYLIDDQTYDVLVRDAQPDIGGNEEIHVLFAAGNSGPFANSTGSPANAKNVITIGAGENYRPGGTDGCGIGASGADNSNDIASFSGRGPTDDGRVKPDLVAPGTHVMGAASQDAGYNGDGVCGPTYYPSGQTLYTWSSGTSHSTPAAAGAASLLYRYYQDNVGGAPPSPAMLKAYLINSARYLTGSGAGDDLPSNAQGFGSIDLGRAFDDLPRLTVDQEHVLHDSGEMFELRGTIHDPAQPFRVTLAWTDAPGSPAAGTAYVNDLDLDVYVNATWYDGNVFSGNKSVSGGTSDTRNNVESVLLPAGANGPFIVRVTGTNIAGDGLPNDGDSTDQDFALVIYNGMEKAGTLRGTVTDSATGDPIVGTTVAAVTGTTTIRTTTAADGTYLLSLNPDEYTVSAWTYGYSQTVLSPIEIVDGLTTTRDLELTPTALHTLSGTVTDADTGASLPSTIRVRGPYGTVITSTTTQPAEGHYTTTLFGGPYSITASARLHRAVTETIGLDADTTQDFALPATTTNGILWGTITNQRTGSPVPDARIRVQPGLTETLSGDGGTYELELPARPYTVVVSAPLHSTITETDVIVPQSNLLRRDYTLPAPALKLEPADGIDVSLNQDQRTTVTAGLGNDGNGELTFSLYEVPNGAAPGGGPDGFGYTYWDDTDDAGATYSWIDATDGTLLSLGDDDAVTVELPFAFDFYGTPVETLRISNNGGVVVNDTSSDLSWRNESLEIVETAGIIVPFWDDLDHTAGAVYYKTLGTAPNRLFVIAWNQRSHYESTDGDVSVELILYEGTNNIKFQYQDVVFGSDDLDYGASATVGIRGVDAGQVLQFGYNSAVLRDEMALCFDYPGTSPCDAGDIPWLRVEPAAGSVVPADTAPLALTFDAADVSHTGANVGMLRIYTNDPEAQPYAQYPLTLTVSHAIAVTPPSSTAMEEAGNVVTHTLRVTNTGTTEDTFTIATTPPPAGWSVTVPASTGVLGGGEGTDLNVGVHIPATASVGTEETIALTITSDADPTVRRDVLLTTRVIKWHRVWLLIARR